MVRAGSRIKAAFARLAAEHRKALIAFITAGDPALAATLPLMHELVKAGVVF
jgi:tryptophan synthase alpha chain